MEGEVFTRAWKSCEAECARLLYESITRISPDRTFEYFVTLQQDVLFPRSGLPVISWSEGPAKMCDHTFRCFISMGSDHWQFISKGANAFLVGLINIAQVLQDNPCETFVGHGVVIETPSCAVCRFSVTVDKVRSAPEPGSISVIMGGLHDM